ncbi:MAG: hypothetical protein AB7S26_26595 [Sandaracinaceae bacterium]
MKNAFAVLSLLGLTVACGSEPHPSTDPEPSSGGGSDCHVMECFRPYECAERCDGPTTHNGCCPCPTGQLDVLVDCPRCEPGCNMVCGEDGRACRCECPHASATCLGAGGARCPDGLLCVGSMGGDGGRCEDRPRGASCGAMTCRDDEMCCDGTCLRPEGRAVVCRPGSMREGEVGARCDAEHACANGLPCVTAADRGDGDEARVGHCAVSTDLGAPCAGATCVSELTCRADPRGVERCLPPR